MNRPGVAPAPAVTPTPATPWCGLPEVVVETLLVVRLAWAGRELARAVVDYLEHRTRRELAEAERLRAAADVLRHDLGAQLVDAGEQIAGAGAQLVDDDLDGGTGHA